MKLITFFFVSPYFFQKFWNAYFQFFITTKISSHTRHYLIRNLIIQPNSFRVIFIFHSMIGTNPYFLCFCNCIHIGPHKQKLPSVFLLLPNHFFNHIGRIFLTGIFYSICYNYDNHFFCLASIPLKPPIVSLSRPPIDPLLHQSSFTIHSLINSI